MTDAPSPPGRRDRKRRDTRRALVEAALDLFEENGFQQTTIEDITDRADVARRTFFRYFPSKESVLYPVIADSADVLSELFDQLDGPIRTRDVIDTMAAAMDLGREDALRHRQARLTARYANELGATGWQTFQAARDVLIDLLRGRTGLPSDHPEVVAVSNLVMAAAMMAHQQWAAALDGTTLGQEFLVALDTLRLIMDEDRPLGSSEPRGPRDDI